MLLGASDWLACQNICSSIQAFFGITSFQLFVIRMQTIHCEEKAFQFIRFQGMCRCSIWCSVRVSESWRHTFALKLAEYPTPPGFTDVRQHAIIHWVFSVLHYPDLSDGDANNGLQICEFCALSVNAKMSIVSELFLNLKLFSVNLISYANVLCFSLETVGCKELILFRDGPLEMLWGGGVGNFRAARFFFR